MVEIQPQSMNIPEPLPDEAAASVPRGMNLQQLQTLAPFAQLIAQFMNQPDPRAERMARVMDEIMIRNFMADVAAIRRSKGFDLSNLDEGKE